MNVKQVIVIRRDLGMRRGKEISQGAHASMSWLTKRIAAAPLTFSLTETEWMLGLFTKVVVQVASEAELLAVYEAARAAGIEAHLITDAGKTEFGGVPTTTAVGIGPDEAERIDPVTKHLRLY